MTDPARSNRRLAELLAAAERLAEAAGGPAHAFVHDESPIAALGALSAARDEYFEAKRCYLQACSMPDAAARRAWLQQRALRTLDSPARLTRVLSWASNGRLGPLVDLLQHVPPRALQTGLTAHGPNLGAALRCAAGLLWLKDIQGGVPRELWLKLQDSYISDCKKGHPEAGNG